jgi:hypothetical protein
VGHSEVLVGEIIEHLGQQPREPGDSRGFRAFSRSCPR